MRSLLRKRLADEEEVPQRQRAPSRPRANSSAPYAGEAAKLLIRPLDDRGGLGGRGVLAHREGKCRQGPRDVLDEQERSVQVPGEQAIGDPLRRCLQCRADSTHAQMLDPVGVIP